MTQRVFLHPGPLKTGTTYLQSLLYANRRALLAQGVTVVGDQQTHFRVANELMRRKSLRSTAVPSGAWKRLRPAVLRAPGDVVMSCERYSLFGPDEARRMLEDLAEREVHVVLTLRDLCAVVPARWQESVKNGATTSWAEFQEEIAGDPSRLRRMTRASNTLEVWASAVPPERLHVVSVPPPGASRTLLFERFSEAIGVDPAGWETAEATRSNPSLDLASTELIRRVNAQRAHQLSGHVQHFEIKSFLAQELAGRDRGRPELSVAAFRAARRESEALVARVASGGFHVVGDLRDLVSQAPPAGPNAGVEAEPEDVIDSAAIAIAALAQRSGARDLRLRELDARQRRPRRSRWRRLLRRMRPSRPADPRRRPRDHPTDGSKRVERRPR